MVKLREMIVKCNYNETEVLRYDILNVIIASYMSFMVYSSNVRQAFNKMRGRQTIVKLSERVKVLRSCKVYLALVTVVTSIRIAIALTLLTGSTVILTTFMHAINGQIQLSDIFVLPPMHTSKQ